MCFDVFIYIFKHIFNHLQENNILTPLHSGFVLGDLSVNQLTFLYNIFCQALDAGKEIRGVFCGISTFVRHSTVYGMQV